MKKEKTVKTYQRRTKSGKMVTVKQHTAKYDAAEKAKEMAKKKGAGEEFDVRKNATQMDIDIDEFLSGMKARSKEEREKLKEAMEKQKSSENKSAEKKSTSKKAEPKAKDSKSCNAKDCGFTAAEFKEWYQGTGSAADKKVAKALKAKLGRAGYKKLEDEAIDNYTSRGHSKMFKSLEGLMVSKEDSKTQLSEANKMSRRVTSLEEKLKQAKDIHSGLRRNDPKKLKYAEKIQKLQKDLIDAKKASDNQNKISDEVNTEKPSKKSKVALKQFKGVETSGNYMTFGKEKTLYYDHYMGGGRDYFTSSEYKKVHSMAKKDIAKLEKAGYSAHFNEDGYVVIDGPVKKSSKGVKDKVVDKFLDGKSIIDDVKKPKKQTSKTEKAPKGISASSVTDLLKKTYKNNLGKVTAKDGHVTISLEGKAYGDGYSSWSQYDVSSGSMESEGNSRHTEGIIKKLKGLKGVKSITVKESFD